MQQVAIKYIRALYIVALLTIPTNFIHAAELRKTAPAASASQVVQTTGQTTSAKSANEQLPTEINILPKASAQAGIATCQSRISQITSFVTGSTRNGALLFAAPAEPDKKQFSISLELLNQASNAPSYITTHFSPLADGTCSGSYEAITYWTTSCQEVAKKVFSEFKPALRPLHQQITILGEGPSARIFLLPASTGCIAIKKEILY